MKCTYRANKDCRMPRRMLSGEDEDKTCQLCLIGQLCDETSLNTRAFMDASINKLEKESEETTFERQFGVFSADEIDSIIKNSKKRSIEKTKEAIEALEE